MLEEFLENNKKRIPDKLIDTPEKKSALVMGALKSYFSPKNIDIKPKYFSNQLTYSKTLANYIKGKIAGNVVSIKSMYNFR